MVPETMKVFHGWTLTKSRIRRNAFPGEGEDPRIRHPWFQLNSKKWIASLFLAVNRDKTRADYRRIEGGGGLI